MHFYKLLGSCILQVLHSHSVCLVQYSVFLVYSDNNSVCLTFTDNKWGFHPIPLLPRYCSLYFWCIRTIIPIGDSRIPILAPYILSTVCSLLVWPLVTHHSLMPLIRSSCAPSTRSRGLPFLRLRIPSNPPESVSRTFRKIRRP